MVSLVLFETTGVTVGFLLGVCLVSLARLVKSKRSTSSSAVSCGISRDHEASHETEMLDTHQVDGGDDSGGE